MPLLVVCASHSPAMNRDLACVQGLVFRSGMDVARQQCELFKPDLVVFFGSDHRRALDTVVPSFSVVSSAEGLGDLGAPTGDYRIPTELVVDLARFLIGEHIDVATIRSIRLDHGIGQTFSGLFGALDSIPAIPIIINSCVPPLPRLARVQTLGATVGRWARTTGKRVLIVGSGGLSHGPASMYVDHVITEDERRRINAEGYGTAIKWINPEWDRRFLADLARPSDGVFMDISDEFIETAGRGAHEIRNWIAAWAAGEGALETIAYEPVPEWITGMGIAISAGAGKSFLGHAVQPSL